MQQIRGKLRRLNIYLYLLEISVEIYDSFSLEDKSKIVDGIIDYAKNNFDVSATEYADREFFNLSSMAFVSVSNDKDQAKLALESIKKRIKENKQVKIIEENIQRLL